MGLDEQKLALLNASEHLATCDAKEDAARVAWNEAQSALRDARNALATAKDAFIESVKEIPADALAIAEAAVIKVDVEPAKVDE